ncbi:MAG: DUF3999 family protein, partial [Comamonadaceae bacterium]
VVYRIGAAGQESTNAPLLLERTSVRWLRVEATHGARLETVPLTVRAVFAPLDAVFVAGATGPYTLATGRPGTPSAALPLAMLPGAAAGVPATAPVASVRDVRERQAQPPPAWAAWLPEGTDARTAGLWAVLAIGVLVLGAVAWKLVRQLEDAKAS